ncbi:hypothetical protein ISR92_02185 [Patescibacteria group bacterium]|nr:hypothetical protein [Patescibacteria group bacterium]
MLIVGCDKKEHTYNYQSVDDQMAELQRQKNAAEQKIEHESGSDQNRATARAVETELKPEFAEVKEVVEETAGKTQARVKKESNDVGKKLDALSREIKELKKQVSTPAPVREVVIERVVAPSTSSKQESLSKSSASTAKAEQPPIGKMKIVVEGYSGSGHVWGPTTSWTINQQPITNGVGAFPVQEGLDLPVNGRVADKFLDKVVSEGLGSVKLIDSAGLEYVFKSTDIRKNEKDQYNLFYSYVDGQFR